MPDPLIPEQIAQVKADVIDPPRLGVPKAWGKTRMLLLIATVEQAWAERDEIQARLDAAEKALRWLANPSAPVSGEVATAITRARDTTRPDTTP